MELALGAMASLTPKLGDLLMQEYVVQKGLKDDIQSLSRELVAMNAALINASKVPPDQLSERDKFWARQVRELSYDMEDAVDDFILRVAGRESATTTSDANVFKKMVGKATTMVKKVKDRHQISDKVKDIKKLSNELAELRAKYTVRGVGANLAANTGIDPRVLNLYKKESDLVSIEDSRDKVIRMLTGTKDHVDASDQSLKIVSIVGIGGLGKTTLAKTVYDMLKNKFGCSAFISVDRTPDMPRIFEKVLVELDQTYKGVDMGRWDVDRFCNELHVFLEHKRYFIIVDDIWDKESWKAIKYALKDNNCGSRIIMTTRNFEVISKEEEVYRLKPLSDQNSKKLFYKRIQSQEGESLDDLSDEVSSKIIDKCGGVPLAIIAIASLLVNRPCEHWLEVYESIGFGNADNTKQILDNTKKILSYSYYDLPSYLKPCLLYLSIYPEDWNIETKDMIWMWIGEGLVHLEEDKGSLFEIGESYFNELVNRSLIQPTKDNQIIPCFGIHDMVLDLIRELSRSENFITILGSNEQHASSSTLKRNKKTGMPHSACKVRRLAVQNQHLQTMDKPEVLRSLCIIESKIESMAPLDSFRHCRVICIVNSYIPSGLLKHLGRLLHLKYLEISKTPVDELPKEIGHLKSVQTLILVDTGLHELPSAVCSLTQLMYLMVQGFKRLPVDRMGNLASLEELYLNHVEERSGTGVFVVELGKLTRLRRVTIEFSKELDESLQKALVQSLCNLRQLEELMLFYGKRELGAIDTTTWEGWEPPRMLRQLGIHVIRFWQLPRWVNSFHLPRLCFLHLYVCVVEVQHLDNLARLPELSHLELRGYSWPAAGYNVGTYGFKNLRFCFVGTALKFHVGAMPRLEELQFRVFPRHRSFGADGVPLEQFPTKDVIGDLDFGLDNLLSLEQVTVVVDCLGATAAEVQEVEVVVSRAVEDHPNRPTINMEREYEEEMVSDERREALIQQHIEEVISLDEWKDKTDASFIVFLRWYRCLQKAVFHIDCEGASMREVDKVEKGFRNAAEAHRNHPTIELIRTNTDKIISPDHSNTEGTTVENPVTAWMDRMEDPIPVTASLGPMAPLLRQIHSLTWTDPIHVQGAGGSGYDTKPLKENLEVLGGDLLEPEENSSTPKWWRKEVRELLYDTEDRLSELIARVEDACETRKRLQLPPNKNAKPHWTPLELWQPISSQVDSAGHSIVGVEEDMNKLVKQLAFDGHNQKQLKVVPILGFPGVGKTTAAETLYHKYRGKFQCSAFVRVSRTPDTRSLFISILSQIKAPRHCGLPDVHDLSGGIKEHLKSKRYLIVIDDLWTASVWDIIRRVFPDGDYGSRIITTTQIHDVALACCRYYPNYVEMSPLNDDQSRRLFFTRIFGSEDRCPSDLKEVSYKIVKKCAGLPLAIVTVASLLARE